MTSSLCGRSDVEVGDVWTRLLCSLQAVSIGEQDRSTFHDKIEWCNVMNRQHVSPADKNHEVPSVVMTDQSQEVLYNQIPILQVNLVS